VKPRPSKVGRNCQERLEKGKSGRDGGEKMERSPDLPDYSATDARAPVCFAELGRCVLGHFL
jgi:hypothetical protein